MGTRPIDLHIKSLEKMGVNFEKGPNGVIKCTTNDLCGAEIDLEYPSVGVTENIMLAAVLAKGTTFLHNAAKEPEIIDLQDLLVKMGAKINGAGTSSITIEGVERLENVEHEVIPDRIVAGTFMIASVITQGDILLKKVNANHLKSVILIMEDIGCSIDINGDTVRVISNEKTKAIDKLRTMPYPGFPTDLQPQITTLMTKSLGTSVIIEKIFENRFNFAKELLKMGADIILEDRVAVIKGVNKLFGAQLNGKDLRGGAALVIAALGASGNSEINGIEYIERGYEDFHIKLKNLGGKIKLV